jgi:hypothetical protein
MRPERVRAAAAALLWMLTFASAEMPPRAAVVSDDARLLLPGLIIDESDFPVDAVGRAVVDAIPGVRARQALDPAIEQRLEALTEQRRRIGEHSAAGAVSEAIPALPGDDRAPSRLDGGDPDPDRLDGAPLAR